MATVEELDNAQHLLRRFRGLGHWEEGHDYYTALPATIQKDLRVAIEAAQLYLVQGHYQRAWAVCEQTLSDLSMSEDINLATIDESHEAELCLKLLSAYVAISRHGRIRTAFNLVKPLSDIATRKSGQPQVEVTRLTVPLRKQTGNLPDNLDINLAGEHQSQICASSASTNPTHDVCDECKTVSEVRILVEFYIWKIVVVVAEQGFLEERPAKERVAQRLDEIRQWTLQHKRFREARFITFFRIDLLNDLTSDIECLRELLSPLQYTTNFKLEEAQTNLDLGRCILNKNKGSWDEASKGHLDRAVALFSEIGHAYGQLDVENEVLTSRRNQIALDELLTKKLELADSYFERRCYQQGIACIIFSIPVSHQLGNIQDSTSAMIQRAQQEIIVAGAIIQEQALFVNAVAQSLVRATEYGFGRRALEDYIARRPAEMGPRIESSLYSSMSLAYSNSGNVAQAAKYAELALSAAVGSASYEDRTDAAFLLATRRIEQANLQKSGLLASTFLSSASIILRIWSHIDLKMGHHSKAADKIAWLAQIDLKTWIDTQNNESLARSDAYLDDALLICRTHNCTSEKTLEVEILQASRQQNHERSINLIQDRLNVESSKPNPSPFALAQLTSQLSIGLHARFLARAQTFNQMHHEERVEVVQDLLKATKVASDAYDLYTRAGGSEMIITALNYLYDLLYMNQFMDAEELFKAWLTEAGKVEHFCDSMRRSVALSANVESLLEKRLIISGRQYRKLYDNAVKICTTMDDANAAWVWIQKAKARSISDLFGLRAVVPASLLTAIQADESAFALFEQERRLIAATTQVDPLGYLHVRRESEQLRLRMRTHPLLARMLDIREGAFNVDLSLSDLDNALSMSGRNSSEVKFIEWYLPSQATRETKVVMLVSNLNGSTTIRNLEMTVGSIQTWLRLRLDVPAGAKPPLGEQSARARLRELGSLVNPLQDLTQPNDLLILSPSSILNRLPLHALPIGPQTLIERNPVLYVASSAILRHAQSRAVSHATRSGTDSQASLFAVYESKGEREQMEHDAIYDHASQIARTMPFRLQTGDAVDKMSFKDGSASSDWIHYHGHALFDKTDVLRSCLVLAGGLEEAQTSVETTHLSATESSGSSNNLTVSDIFDIDMQDSAPHVTIVACDSGTQDIAAGDEPLGLISAFMFAGATSVIGTLWPVESQAGRKFSELFYSGMRQQWNGAAPGSTVIIDLAQALRRTVCEMMKKENADTKAPLHWAAYVLHGCWFRDYRKLRSWNRSLWLSRGAVEFLIR